MENFHFYYVVVTMKRGDLLKNIFERQSDVLSIVASLDISPTMYENAVTKYKAITSFLCEYGIKADIYPQGSFALGTVVRPSAKNASAFYDLDFICQLGGSKADYSPSGLRNKIEDALRSSKVYGGKLEICKECFSIEYADIDGVGFVIDIVPATDEALDAKEDLRKKSEHPQLIDTAIAIPKHNAESNYRWITNNPRGYRAWFEDINKPFLAVSQATSRMHLFEENRSLYASVEDVPSALERSSLQRVIQILKHHRNVYYEQFEDGDSVKPISAIINTVVARISAQADPTYSVFELLSYVLQELEIYSQQQSIKMEEFLRIYESRSVFSRPDGKWYISNPANPEDNLADQWNTNSMIPSLFFRWIKSAKEDLINTLEHGNDSEFRVALENGFGSMAVSSVLSEKYSATRPARPIILETAPKPYRGY